MWINQFLLPPSYCTGSWTTWLKLQVDVDRNINFSLENTPKRLGTIEPCPSMSTIVADGPTLCPATTIVLNRTHRLDLLCMAEQLSTEGTIMVYESLDMLSTLPPHLYMKAILSGLLRLCRAIILLVSQLGFDRWRESCYLFQANYIRYFTWDCCAVCQCWAGSTECPVVSLVVSRTEDRGLSTSIMKIRLYHARVSSVHRIILCP